MEHSIKRAELRAISLFAPDVRSQHVTAMVDHQKLGHLVREKGQRRTAEVLFVVRRQNPAARGDDTRSEILLVRRNIYPAGIYRLPTGGIEAGETPRQAAVREITEETGYRVAAPGLLGVVQYTLQVAPNGERAHGGDKRLPFVSYVFVADISAAEATGVGPTAGLPDEIDDYRWIKLADLGHAAAHLRTLNGEWSSWGRFRAVPYEFIQANLV